MSQDAGLRARVLRALTRHQRVRDRGRPLVSALVGDAQVARELWSDWTTERERHRGLRPALTFEIGRRIRLDAALAAVRAAVAFAVEEPRRPVAIVVGDRLREMLDDDEVLGVIEVSTSGRLGTLKS